MNIFRKCLKREFGKQQYNKYIAICREELKHADILQEQYNIEEKGIFRLMYTQMQSMNREDLQNRWEHIMATLLRAFRIGKQFGIAVGTYLVSCLLLIGLELNPAVTRVSLLLISVCFLYKVYEYVENKVCFADAYLFMIYKSVLEKLTRLQDGQGEM